MNRKRLKTTAKPTAAAPVALGARRQVLAHVHLARCILEFLATVDLACMLSVARFWQAAGRWPRLWRHIAVPVAEPGHHRAMTLADLEVLMRRAGNRLESLDLLYMDQALSGSGLDDLQRILCTTAPAHPHLALVKLPFYSVRGFASAHRVWCDFVAVVAARRGAGIRDTLHIGYPWRGQARPWEIWSQGALKSLVPGDLVVNGFTCGHCPVHGRPGPVRVCAVPGCAVACCGCFVLPSRQGGCHLCDHVVCAAHQPAAEGLQHNCSACSRWVCGIRCSVVAACGHRLCAAPACARHTLACSDCLVTKCRGCFARPGCTCPGQRCDGCMTIHLSRRHRELAALFK